MLIELPNMQGGRTFTNKRPGLMLSLPDRELPLYVMDGESYFDGRKDTPVISSVQFGRWEASFCGNIPVQDERNAFSWNPSDDGSMWQCDLEVIFHMIAADESFRRRNPGQHRMPEVLAVSHDGCKTFNDNQHCSLFRPASKLFIGA